MIGSLTKVRAVGAVIALALTAVSVLAVPPASAKTPSARAQALSVYDHMTWRQRVGQLFMIGVSPTSPSHSLLAVLRRDDADNVYLEGESSAGVTHIAHDTARLRSRLAQHGVKPFIGTDQEGGGVQRLRGAGFSDIPSQFAQGQFASTTVQNRAHKWARQLRHAGLNMNLAPVADTVPRSIGTRNQPIGASYREFGYTPGKVERKVAASVAGWQSGGIATTLKHFPGLGRASGNTDTESHVTDPTRIRDPYLEPFRSGIKAGAQFVMVSSAFYPHIDAKHQACFSKTVITTLLRRDLHFTGIVITDSFSSASIASISPSKRGVGLIQAGGTMVLDSGTADLHPMASGILHEVHISRHFSALVKAAVLLVLTMKARDHLL